MHYVLDLREVDPSQVSVVGAKAAHLAEVARVEGVHVPAGFCVTTAGFERILRSAPSIEDQLDRLARLHAGDDGAIRALSAEIRRIIEAVAIPDDVAWQITRARAALGERTACAVRSSATVEDLPTASAAGQQDSYLNVRGPAAVLGHISRCWGSLFTERAVAYRLRSGVDHRRARMAVVVQEMVLPHAAGTLFTADPVSGNRKVTSVEAGLGLGEGVVSGRVSADAYRVRSGEIIDRTIAAKRRATRPVPAGGTAESSVAPALARQPALTDAQVVRLAQLGRRIEAHLGHPQDIEWCLADDHIWILQSRPITTLFPVPAVDDPDNHVYVSVGHQQMMTDPMKPLGLSFWQMTTPRPMCEAGGRLFVDVTRQLAAPATRDGLLAVLGRSDPLIGDALVRVLERGDFIRALPDEEPAEMPPGVAPATIETDPAIVTELIERTDTSVAAAARAIRGLSGPELLDFIRADMQELKRVLFDPRSREVIMAGMQAAWWLDEHLRQWLGDKDAVDVLTQSVDHNVTSEMGLALLDVADVIREHSELVAFLQRVEDVGVGEDAFLHELARLPGGGPARDAIRGWLDRYGMRCVGEIDITRPRFSERPSMLVPLIRSNIDNCSPGAGARRFEQGRREAVAKRSELLERLRVLPSGERKAQETGRMIDRLRAFSGYREYPKYGMVSRYFVYKRALLKEAERLVRADVLGEREDIFYLRFDELKDVVRTHRVDPQLIDARRDAFASYQSLTPPRVMTSDGEVIAATYRRTGVPSGALVGLPVSTGIVEGRARVIHDIGQSDLQDDDILVTPYTDPSWTPAFPVVKALVTEVGGQMTHGAVIAREYGLPAVVGVEHATQLIRDRQRIRVNGTDGYVELLPGAAS